MTRASSQPVPMSPTPERLVKAHRNVDVILDDQGWPLTMRINDHPLAVFYRKGRKQPRYGITGLQYQCGMQYYATAYEAGVLHGGVPDLTTPRVDGGQRHNLSDKRLEAQQRHNNTIKALTRQAKDVLSDLVLSEVPIRVYADRFRHFPQYREREAITLQKLREALDELVEIFGVNVRRSGIRTSGLDDYRPAIPLPDQSKGDADV